MSNTAELDSGFHYDISFDEYKALPYLNHSTLKWADKSARHLKWALDGKLERKSTDSMRLGRLIHCGLLEGMDKLDFRFPTAEPCGAELKSGPRKGQPCGNSSSLYLSPLWYCGQHAPAEASQPEDYATEAEMKLVTELNHEIRLHPIVKLLRQHGGCEITWVSEIDGVPMKGRIDKYIEPNERNGMCATVIDLKTIQLGEGSIEKCQKASVKYGYHVQAALYQLALQKILGVEQVAVVIVFVEKSAPFDCTVIQATDTDMNIGRSDLHRWIGKYKDGMQSGRWPGVCTEIDENVGLLPERYTRSYVGNFG